MRTIKPAFNYVVVEVFGLVVQDVIPFENFDEACTHFKKFTNVTYEEVYGENGDYKNMPEDYDQTSIHCINGGK